MYIKVVNLHFHNKKYSIDLGLHSLNSHFIVSVELHTGLWILRTEIFFISEGKIQVELREVPPVGVPVKVFLEVPQ